MSGVEFIANALKPFSEPQRVSENTVAVPTHCLYPSGASVMVFVHGGANRAVVSDDGGAISELLSHNRIVDDPDRVLRRFCRRSGLHAKGGAIISPTVSADQLAAAILYVANVSAAVVEWGAEHLKAKYKRNIRQELHDLLSNSFEKSRIMSEERLQGKSNRSYKFDRVIRLNRDHLLVVDPVLPDSNSINARAIAHLDLKQRGDENIVQRVVYDDDLEWDSADLNLLQMAATLVPLSRAGASFSGITAVDSVR